MASKTLVVVLLLAVGAMGAGRELGVEREEVVRAGLSLRKPEQVKLALAGRDSLGNPTGMTVGWFTWEKTESVVEYGKSAEALDSRATGGSRQYLPLQGHHHAVRLTGLEAGTRYYYRVGDGGKWWSETRRFVTAPGNNTAGFGVSVFGDM
eukprot:Sspe_Gene.92639::Locus_65287_Transcript_1_1_Confidence_1.000_Length_495::g.92639::m.92639